MGHGTLVPNVRNMITIVDYGLGNLLSVAKAFEEVAEKKEVVISKAPMALGKATHIVLPGVGNFRTGMQNLIDMEMVEPLTQQVLHNKKPFMGICLGMQLLAEVGEEHDQTAGLGWIPGRARLLDVGCLKLPHIGWDDIDIIDKTLLFENIPRNREFYFVHSYYLDCMSDYITARCTYGQTFPAAIRKDNIFATQFHPEKSRDTGLKILENFLRFSC